MQAARVRRFYRPRAPVRLNRQDATPIGSLVAGLIMAVAAPFLGGFMDRGGAKKPVLFALMLILAAASAGLALVAPGVPYAIPLAGLLLVISSCAYTVSELFHNALLPAAGTPRRMHGAAWYRAANSEGLRVA